MFNREINIKYDHGIKSYFLMIIMIGYIKNKLIK